MLYDYLFYFVVYSFIGWCTEVCFCSVSTGKFVNRGFLNGPVCPIYGFGMVIVIYTHSCDGKCFSFVFRLNDFGKRFGTCHRLDA